MTNFLVISTLYLGSLLIFFLYKIHYISWNITLFNPFILLFISTILGFWGQHKRRELFLDELNYRKGGVWIYMGMAILSISSVAYAFQTSNTAMIASFEEGIIYTHLTMGGAFVIYVMKNFRIPILEGLSVWGRLYFPEELTHRFIRFIGLATIILLVIIDQKTPINRWKAGLANYKADVYQQEGEFLLAQKNYHLAYAFYPNNFKAHYTLAMTAFNQRDYDKSIKLFEDMVTYRIPNQFALINMANAYALNNDFYNAHFTLKKATTQYPENGYLLHNLAFYSEKSQDSKDVYPNYILAQQKLPKEKAHLTYANLLAFSGDSKGIDSLLQASDYNESVAVAGNKIALANLNKLPLKLKRITFKDSTLTAIEVSYLINSLHHSLNDESLRKQAYQFSQTTPENKELLTYALATNAYRRFNYLETDSLLKETVVSASASVAPYYYHEAGKIYLAFGDEERAELCFKESFKTQPLQPVNNAPFYLAQLQLKNGKFRTAIETLEYLSQFEPTKQKANHLLYSLSVNSPAQLDTLAQYTLTNVANFNPWFVRNKMIQPTVTNTTNIKLASLRRAIESEEYMIANTVWNSISLSKSDKKSAFTKLRLEQLVTQERYKEMTSLLNKKGLVGYDSLYTSYFKALEAEYKGDIATAESLFKKALQQIPFYEPWVCPLLTFTHRQKKMKKRLMKSSEN